MSELWVIEAVGKKYILEGILARIGVDARVQATAGHFLEMPRPLKPLGIDSRMRDFRREPTDIDMVRRIRDMAREAGRVVVATDADIEGDVIAWDVAELISDIHPAPARVHLKGMDDDSVKEAIASAGTVRKEDAIPGRTRAIVDRMIGSVFSHDGIVVGRVATAVLGLVANGKPPVWRLNLSAPAKDGGRPWLAECDIRPPMTRKFADRIAATPLPALDLRASSTFVSPPGHTGDIMVRAAEKLGFTPGETSKAMQRAYESGRLSYPRAGSKGMSRAAARKMRRIVEKAGYKFDDGAVADKGDEPHDAPHPIGKADLGLNPAKMGVDEGIRTMIARDLVRSGQQHVRETPVTARLEAFLIQQGFPPDVARMVAALDWHRDQGPRFPGQESWQDSEVVQRPADAVVLEAMLGADLGRPSTWANSVEKFLDRGLVDGELQLTAKGQAWVDGSPPELLDPRISVAIERACERMGGAMPADPDREPWEMLAERIVGALPEAVREPLLASVAAEPPREKRDFRALAEPGLDFSELAARPAPAYTPDP